MLIQTDSRRRITLPSSSGIKPGDTVDIEILEDGCIKLIPVEAIPRHQLWAWTIENKQIISAALTDPRPSTVVDTETEADAIAKRWVGED
ncbi:MAG: AbrB/MazE/SpoVT family DNA-binding domain-containing protein [Desulfuromonadales bacterium]|nr:AbrB/MazE/SpoVT family DNA-binding domain-containing protein [Desulfuromonadales bacterium]MDT8424265.1 AbrB/MazE/SpoVT family DNA-binding domain-containing protein [Desulfuromonadales bacterium]